MAQRSGPEPRKCEGCDVVFTPKRADARFHSDRCRVAKWNRDHPRVALTEEQRATS